jgi:hypothetical protein
MPLSTDFYWLADDPSIYNSREKRPDSKDEHAILVMSAWASHVEVSVAASAFNLTVHIHEVHQEGECVQSITPYSYSNDTPLPETTDMHVLFTPEVHYDLLLPAGQPREELQDLQPYKLAVINSHCSKQQAVQQQRL